MKLPISLLKKYVDVALSPEKLAERLTMSGTAVERIEKRDGDAVLDIEVTTNRPDCLSVLGLAQEVSALTGKKIRFPKISNGAKSNNDRKSGEFPKIIVEDKKGCPRYTARLIRGVQIQSSPSDIQKTLAFFDAKAINHAVDATNFVLFEMGQPLHAFDYDKIKGGAVVVRRAKKGEKFLALDGAEYTLDAETLVIADLEKPIAMAGVIGGKLTEVTSQTKNILLESAFFDPVLVRQTSRRYKISTESSYRFERGVNPENVEWASTRAADLIVEWGGGAQSITTHRRGVLNTPHDWHVLGRIQYAPTQITLSTCDVSRMLGTRIPKNRISSILKNLGFGVKMVKQDVFSVTVQSSRRDVTGPADLVEEILRIEGFEKIPAKLPPTIHGEKSVKDAKAEGILELKKWLAAAGFTEAITLSLLSENSLESSGLLERAGAQRIKNPLSAEQAFLRPSLLPGLLGVVLFNVHRKADSLKIFEIGNRFVNGREETAVGILLYGHFENSWSRKSESSFFDLKGALQNLLKFLGVEDYEWQKKEKSLVYQSAVSVVSRGAEFGEAGALSPEILKNWDIPKELFFAEIILENLFYHREKEKASSKPRVKPIHKFPSVRRDIAFVLENKVSVKSLEALMLGAGAPYLKEANLFDQYLGKNIPKDKRSLAFSLAYQKDTGTFTDEEIQTLQSKVGQALKEAFSVEFR